MKYNFREIENKCQKKWRETNPYKVDIDNKKEKYYILDMFPYPSGAGLHVGHPLGYIASDVIARYKTLRGFNVLHPMGFDSFGLPAEQYAIQTGKHPKLTTEENISRYKEQMNRLGLSYDWDREIKTSDPKYYKWTQWIFINLFNHYYDKDLEKAVPISKLESKLVDSGNIYINAHCNINTPKITSDIWLKFNDKEKSDFLLNYRLAYLSNSTVNWCPQLGSVLANDEIKNGLSERGGYPVIKKEMKQWYLRITAYADRLISGLEKLEWDNSVKESQKNWIGKEEIGSLVTYKMRDAIFSRQRYWGEPIPVYYKDGIPKTLDFNELPLILPDIDKYLPTEEGEPPLARSNKWFNKNGYPLETNTMPGWAGSSWYFLRYMDNHNSEEIVSTKALNYWKEIDLYIGGAEHTTGHLLYMRFWTNFLYDIGITNSPEPAIKLINQGMITGVSKKVMIVINEKGIDNPKNPEDAKYQFYSWDLNHTDPKSIIVNVDISLVNDDSSLDLNKYLEWRSEYKKATFYTKGGYWFNGEFYGDGESKFFTYSEVEKMSKSKFNVVNPDDIIEKYGSDTLRLYEMFLGPIEQSKPWNTKGIEGIWKFLGKIWRLFYNESGELLINYEDPNETELKIINKCMKRVEEDLERFSFNTPISSMMICVNELGNVNCHKYSILKDLLIMLHPYAPHITEELWEKLNISESIRFTEWPKFNPNFVKESTFECPISINGKIKHKMILDLDLSEKDIERIIFDNDIVKELLRNLIVKKTIIIKNKIVNLVV